MLRPSWRVLASFYLIISQQITVKELQTEDFSILNNDDSLHYKKFSQFSQQRGVSRRERNRIITLYMFSPRNIRWKLVEFLKIKKIRFVQLKHVSKFLGKKMKTRKNSHFL